MIRACSRVGLATRHSIFLDGKRLLIHTLYVSVGDHGRERFLSDLRQQFWIIKARAAVRTVWNVYQHCRNHRAEPYIPPMTQLPPVRMEGFVVHGGQLFRPFPGHYRTQEGETLRCTLYMPGDLSCTLGTHTFFVYKFHDYGSSGNDNGTNFTRAQPILAEIWAELDQNQVQQQTSTERIEWEFVPPGIPHMGGTWERLVRLVMTALEAIMTKQAQK